MIDLTGGGVGITENCVFRNQLTLQMRFCAYLRCDYYTEKKKNFATYIIDVKLLLLLLFSALK